MLSISCFLSQAVFVYFCIFISVFNSWEYQFPIKGIGVIGILGERGDNP